MMKIKTLLLISLLLLSSTLWAERPKLLLLKNYKISSSNDKNISNWLMSEKLDGIRAYWDGKQLLTRNGNIIHAPKYFTKNYPSFEVDGELWSKRGDFENIASIVLDKTPSKNWNQIKHYIFEVPNQSGGILKRLEIVKPFESNIFKIIPQIKIRDKKHLDTFLHEIESQKGEGVVIRDPKALYINKRTSKVLKVKTFHDMECRVMGYTKGKGKFEDVIGAIKCQLENEIEFKIGSGLSYHDRKYPPKIGTLITFKYKEFTKYGKPRFPVYLRVAKQK